MLEKASQKEWYAIYTKYKCEKYVVDKLNKKGIEAYVPLLSSWKSYASKKKKVSIPLIHNYAFVKIDKKQHIKVLETDYVLGFVCFERARAVVKESEIELLKRITGEISDVKIDKRENLRKGEEVEIISGSLTGVRGLLIDFKGKKELLIELTSIGYHLRMNVDINKVQSLSKLKLV